MTEDELRSYLDRVAEALEGMAPVAPGTNWPVLIAAFVAFAIGIGTIWQKSRADARAEWWRRTQWGLEAFAAEEQPKINAYGTEMLRSQLGSRLAGKAERKFLEAAWQDVDAVDDNADDRISTDDLDELGQYFTEYGVEPGIRDTVRRYLAGRADERPEMDDEPDEIDNGETKEGAS